MENRVLDLKLEVLEDCEVLENEEFGAGFFVGGAVVVGLLYGAGAIIFT